MDQQLVAAIEAQDDDLEQARGIEAKAELPYRAVLVQITEKDRVPGGMDSIAGSDAVPTSGDMNPHPT